MARQARETDYTVSVEGVGMFAFGRRTMRDEIAIQVEYARIIDGVTPTEWLALVGGWMSALRILTVRAPDGWDIDALDPTDPETYSKLSRVYEALTEKERSFRQQSKPAGEGVSA